MPQAYCLGEAMLTMIVAGDALWLEGRNNLPGRTQ